MLWSSHEAVPRVIFTQGISIVRSLPLRVIAIRNPQSALSRREVLPLLILR